MNPIQPADDAISTLMRVALQSFEYVVVDAGSKLDLQRAYHLDPSVTLYLVAQFGIPELRNANRLIRQIPAEGGPNVEVVVNRFDSGTEGIDEAQVAKALTRPVRWKIPNDYAAVRRMQNSVFPADQGRLADCTGDPADDALRLRHAPRQSRKRRKDSVSFRSDFERRSRRTGRLWP